jgi:anti-sigma factor (TIGR02949 family)
MTDPPAPMIPCDQAVRQLWEYVERAVNPVDHARIEDHLAICRQCCGEVEFIKHLRQLLASQTSDDVPPEALRQLDRFVEEL